MAAVHVPSPPPFALPLKGGGEVGENLYIQRACACGGGCPRCTAKPQAKLTVGAPDDVYEREADSIATKIVSETPASSPAHVAPVSPQRRVGAVSEASGDTVEEAPSELDEGHALDPGTRGFFEARLGHDLRHVRVHTGARASTAAQGLNARAYTLGADVVFGAGEYAPATTPGRQLLAHELVHVVQQGAAPPLGARAAPATPVAPRIQREEGTSVYSEHVTGITTSSDEPGVWSGHVRREERTAEGRLFHTGRAPVRYDENACAVSIPMTVAFRHATLADVQNCPPQLDQPAPTSLPANVDSTRFGEIREEYIRSINTDLNGWYAVRFHGCEDNPCHGRDMPIEVQVTEAAAGGSPDYEVAIANMGGRSCVDDTNYVAGGLTPATVVLYARGLDDGTASHEGGHMVLGHGDEYREREAPGPARPPDRVREGDWSRMASHHRFGRFALMHARHYEFVPAFLNRARRGCDARLVELSRPSPLDFRVVFGIGYAGFFAGGGITSGLYEDLGLEMGVPLSRLRDWEMILGLHGRFLGEVEGDSRLAFLLGLRLGLEHTFTPSTGGFTVGGFGEAGLAWFEEEDAAGGDWQTGGYAEGGAYGGYTTSPGSPLGGSTRMTFRLEAAAGSMWPAVGVIGAPGMTLPTDPESLEYFRIGLSLGGEF